MPIAGLTDRETIEQAGMDDLPCIAKIFKGTPKRTMQKDGKDIEIMGEDLSYIRVKFSSGYEELEPYWRELYGEAPKVLSKVQLIGSTPDMAFPNFIVQFRGKKLQMRSDKKQVLYERLKDGTVSTTPRPYIASEWKYATERAVLKFWIPELIAVTGVLGYIQWGCGSTYEIPRIYKYLHGFYRMFGGFSLDNIGLTFDLYRADNTISYVDKKDGKEKSQVKSLVHIRVTPDVMKQLIGQTQQTLLPPINPDALLPAVAVSQDDFDNDDYADMPSAEDGFEAPPVHVPGQSAMFYPTGHTYEPGELENLMQAVADDTTIWRFDKIRLVEDKGGRWFGELHHSKMANMPIKIIVYLPELPANYLDYCEKKNRNKSFDFSEQVTVAINDRGGYIANIRHEEHF